MSDQNEAWDPQDDTERVLQYTGIPKGFQITEGNERWKIIQTGWEQCVSPSLRE